MQDKNTAPTGRMDPAALAEPKPHAVTFKSLMIGLAGVLFICGLTPYNDYAVANTFLVGNFLPIGLVLFLMVLIFLVNTPLLKCCPRFALREGELAVVMAMMLVSCSLPSSGLMRYLPSGIVGLYSAAAERPTDYGEVIAKAGIPAWLLPDTPATDPAEIDNTDVFKYYRTRAPDGVVPWAAWIRPLAVWGIFVALLWGTMLFICVLVRRQWAENERLAFPLATVYNSLIEAPRPGYIVNDLFRSRGFWIALVSVFILHSFNVLHRYTPSVPEIPLNYNFQTMLADDPWRYASYGFKSAALYFCVIGISFFLQTKIAFSLWAYFILLQVAQMLLEGNQVSFTDQMKHDQTFGGLIVMSGVIFWIGRQHWWMILRHMFGFARTDETESRYLPYCFAGWATFFCFAGLIVWFMCVGVSFAGALVIALLLLMMLMMVARILAETGLVFVQINWLMYRFWYYPLLLAPEPIKTTPTTFFFAGWMTGMFHDLRESFAGFFLQSMRVADQSAYERAHRWRTSVSFIFAIVLALGVGYVTASASMLWTEYNYFATMSAKPESPINGYGFNNAPRNNALEPSLTYEAGVPQENGTTIGLNIGIGAAIVGAASFLRITFAWWPLHPIGFIVLYSYATQMIWLSMFVGWMAKVIIVRMGGASLLRSAKPVFIGLVVGEATAAGVWLVVSLALNWMGYEYHKVLLLPG